MITGQTRMDVTPEALVIRIPWSALASTFSGTKRRGYARKTVEEVLHLVQEGRAAHGRGKSFAIRSLKDLL